MSETQILETTCAEKNTMTTDLVPSSDPRAAIISIDPERLGGAPCFVGTRVPVRYLFEYLSKGKTLAEFLDDFEGVPREEALAALEQAYDRLLEGLPQPFLKISRLAQPIEREETKPPV